MIKLLATLLVILAGSWILLQVLLGIALRFIPKEKLDRLIVWFWAIVGAAALVIVGGEGLELVEHRR